MLDLNSFDWQKKTVWNNWKKCQKLVKTFKQFQNNIKQVKALRLQDTKNILVYDQFSYQNTLEFTVIATG